MGDKTWRGKKKRLAERTSSTAHHLAHCCVCKRHQSWRGSGDRDRSKVGWAFQAGRGEQKGAGTVRLERAAAEERD